MNSSRVATSPEDAIYRKVSWRLLPFLFVAYLVAIIDRQNVGFAQTQISADLGLSYAAFGLGAGVFFIGYFIFEVPSNLLMQRIGARKTFQRILILWGLAASAMMFVHAEWLFYVLRFLIGAFEAGFVPAVLFYLTLWYPGVRRGRITALVFIASPLAGFLGAPISGVMLSGLDGVAGLFGWQWMFLLQGLPAVVLGLIAHLFVTDGPTSARWLTPAEVALLQTNIDNDPDRASSVHSRFSSVLKDGRIYALAFVYFSMTAGVYIVLFWLPSLLTEAGGLLPWQMGLWLMIPYAAAMAGMFFISRRSDRTGERRWHLVISAGIALVALVAATQSNAFWLTLILLSIATAGIYATTPIFYTIPPKILTGAAAAGGIALINSVGNLSGFVTPYAIGAIKDLTGSTEGGLWAVAGVMLIGCVVLVLVTRGLRPDRSLDSTSKLDAVAESSARGSFRARAH